MCFERKIQHFRRFITLMAFVFLTELACLSAVAQDVRSNIDPRLSEIVQIVKTRAIESNELETEPTAPVMRDEKYLDLIDRIQISSYSRDIDGAMENAKLFQKVYNDDAPLDLSQVYYLHELYSDHLSSGGSVTDLQKSLGNFVLTANWFEKYLALSLSAHVHSTSQKRQSALQQAQRAFTAIPQNLDPEDDPYVKYAKTRILSLISHLHNLQGNSDLAITTSLAYLNLTKNEPNPKSDVDLINNLIYSYSIARNQSAQLYLSKELLEIEKYQNSSVPGLSEMRISGVMNASGRFQEGLDYAKRSVEKAANPIVIRVGQVNKAIALAGLGRFEEAREIADVANVILAPDHVLNTETRTGDLYLAFLIAQSEDKKYATQIFNRKLDVTAQKFLASNSQDTTAMLAELENSRERQAERDAALAREAELQAITISRQRNLNRTLTVLVILLALGTIAGMFFIQYREKVLRKLEIKTKEAASAEKLKTEFLGMISHELRTPLNGIIGISDYLANYHEDQDIRDKTGIVLRSGNELLAVVESLTDMARIDANQLNLIPHDTNLGEALATIPEMWIDTAEAKGLAFTHFIDPAITLHHLDEDRLIQCLNILMSNAVSFTDKGRVHLHITRSKDEDSSLTAIVADTGQGMNETVQSRLFTPFMQADTSRKRDHMGTGLSLAIAYALVELMGGTLTVVTREGRGSEFTITIPLADAKEDPKLQNLLNIDLQGSEADSVILNQLPRPVLNSAHGPGHDIIDLMAPPQASQGLHNQGLRSPEIHSPKHVLIVDDIGSNRDILRLMLEAQGFECGEAADGFAAIGALEQRPYDLVFLDIHMAPLDGIETLRRLRSSGKSYANIPVIALTADNAANTNAACMQAGANLFLTKPVHRTEIFKAMRLLEDVENTRILSQRA